MIKILREIKYTEHTLNDYDEDNYDNEETDEEEEIGHAGGAFCHWIACLVWSTGGRQSVLIADSMKYTTNS